MGQPVDVQVRRHKATSAPGNKMRICARITALGAASVAVAATHWSRQYVSPTGYSHAPCEVFPILCFPCGRNSPKSCAEQSYFQ